MGLSVAILGATGLVGQKFVQLLEERNFPLSSLRLLASERSRGKKLIFQGEELEVEEATPSSFQGVDIALFSGGADVDRYFAPLAVKKGAVVIDNSSAFRMDEGTPLVVPEVNVEDIKLHRGIIANPNCSTIQMVVALYPLHKLSPLKRIIVSTYQAVSGSGAPGVEELKREVELLGQGQTFTPQFYPHQIALSLIPQVDDFDHDGYTKEEWKMVNETRKKMHAPDIAISATCVRVPVVCGHSEAIWAEFSSPIEVDAARNVLRFSPGVEVMDEPQKSIYPLPQLGEDKNAVLVGRIRKDLSSPSGLVLWVVADNLRKGAALNAIQIAEVMMQKGWI
jgi:aspartate-semialdehyde dehydrogenase